MMLAVVFLYALYFAEGDFFYTYFAESLLLLLLLLFACLFAMNGCRFFFNFVPIEITV